LIWPENLRQCAQLYSSTEWLFFFHPLRVDGTSFSHCRAKVPTHPAPAPCTHESEVQIHLDSRLPRSTPGRFDIYPTAHRTDAHKSTATMMWFFGVHRLIITRFIHACPE
jgi:hypothetical protein